MTNLASKLLLTMLPPNEPCFRLRVNNLVMEREEEDADKEFRTKIEKALSRIEQAVLADVEASGDRPVVAEGNQHLIVAGNVLYHDDPKKGLRLFPLSRYVVERDPMGTPVEPRKPSTSTRSRKTSRHGYGKPPTRSGSLPSRATTART